MLDANSLNTDGFNIFRLDDDSLAANHSLNKRLDVLVLALDANSLNLAVVVLLNLLESQGLALALVARLSARRR
jgi:hypothetical protein